MWSKCFLFKSWWRFAPSTHYRALFSQVRKKTSLKCLNFFFKMRIFKILTNDSSFSKVVLILFQSFISTPETSRVEFSLDLHLMISQIFSIVRKVTPIKSHKRNKSKDTVCGKGCDIFLSKVSQRLVIHKIIRFTVLWWLIFSLSLFWSSCSETLNDSRCWIYLRFLIFY